MADETDQPTFSWSCSGQWEYFKVWVYNSTTGVAYDGGWINAPNQTTYDWPFTLPWGHYWTYVIVWHPQCGYSEWSAPIDWTVSGNCCIKPTLDPVPDGEQQPTYHWSCGAGEWTWFHVDVINVSTGAYYGSGWVNKSDDSWTSTYVLPSGYYQAWLQLYHESCGVSEWSDPQDWTVGGGGNASVRFFNNLTCSGTKFTATFTICGKAFNSLSGTWSSCDDTFTPGTCSWTLYANAGSCGTLTGSGSYTLAAGKVYNWALTLSGGQPAIGVNVQDGDCSTPKPWSFDTSFEVLQTFPNEGFKQGQ